MAEESLVAPIGYEEASDEVRAVYDDIMRTHDTNWVNNFWKVLAHDPVLLKTTWEDIKQVMAPGELDTFTKELIYIAVSATNGSEYCTYSQTASARKQGMTDVQLMELLAVVGMANETNRLSNGLRPAIDVQFKPR